ncbi:nucleotidyltransferase family protein [Paucibacter sp. R3-3]|uniref:Nucleotidyltransferase family protein n=1 Tax=Roseateles agri TaxID=3098619 RepID=A0ABU5DLT9_9BURK|nr:nucleotidyltransferase family protein [Paucibacter sp. R3-3]MDY0747263.1 nucleotidyltransferase family protein [Paucibacter sp. R3-3]
MSLPRARLLLHVLLDPTAALALSPLDWDLLLRQARRGLLLTKLAVLLQPMLDRVPPGPRHHLYAALLTAQRQAKLTHWEVSHIRAALAPLGFEPILLKGTAYLMAGLPASEGRVFGDVDILVPQARIAEIEAALLAQGWQFPDDLDDYDRRYYREWMHEIPPLTHLQRGSSLDVHHTILPPTARVRVNTAALFEDTRTLPHQPGVRVLAPVTMTLHSAAHLFHEGELEKGLRDLFDLDALLRDFGRDTAFWAALVPRARVLGLTRPLFHALRYTTRLLGTPVPADVMEQAAVDAPRFQKLLDACYERALMPAHASCDTSLTGLTRLALYVRSHWLRMPLGLLAQHLARKAWLRMRPEPETESN